MEKDLFALFFMAAVSIPLIGVIITGIIVWLLGSFRKITKSEGWVTFLSVFLTNFLCAIIIFIIGYFVSSSG